METKGNKWEIITLYESTIETDERGPSQSIGTFSSQSDATQFAKGKSWYGGDGRAVQISAVRLHHAGRALGGRGDLIFNDVYKIAGAPLDVDLHERVRKENRRQELIDSLSDEDLNILGVKK